MTRRQLTGPLRVAVVLWVPAIRTKIPAPDPTAGTRTFEKLPPMTQAGFVGGSASRPGTLGRQVPEARGAVDGVKTTLKGIRAAPPHRVPATISDQSKLPTNSEVLQAQKTVVGRPFAPGRAGTTQKTWKGLPEIKTGPAASLICLETILEASLGPLDRTSYPTDDPQSGARTRKAQEALKTRLEPRPETGMTKTTQKTWKGPAEN